MRRTILALAAVLMAAPAVGQETVYVRHASPAWLGISYDMLWVQQDGSCAPLVVVEAVVQGSPAERAGLRAGDAILAIDGEPQPAKRLQAIASSLQPGDSVRLRLKRDGAVREVTAIADRRPERPVRVFGSMTSGLRASTAPVIEVLGDSLIARNLSVEWDPGRTRSYWVSLGNGEAEYRVISGWSRTDLDRRVADLLTCADSARSEAPIWTTEPTARVDLAWVQERADSLRVIYTQRALERKGQQGATSPFRIVSPRADGRVTVSPAPEGSFAFRVEEHVAVGLRGVAGAELTAMEPELAEYFRNADRGLLVLRIAPDTPSDRAGLRPGDVVIAADGRRLESVEELRRIIALPNAGAVELRVVRRGRTRDLTLPRQ